MTALRALSALFTSPPYALRFMGSAFTALEPVSAGGVIKRNVFMSTRGILSVIFCSLVLSGNSIRTEAQVESAEKKAEIDTLALRLKDLTFRLEQSRLPADLKTVVKGAPYSATATTEHTQTLSDGNQIIKKNETIYYRDSEGRTRVEQRLTTIGKWTSGGDPTQLIMITDPVAGYHYQLDPRNRTARKQSFKPVDEKAEELHRRMLEAYHSRLITQTKTLAELQAELAKKRLHVEAEEAKKKKELQSPPGVKQTDLQAEQLKRQMELEANQAKRKMELEAERAKRTMALQAALAERAKAEQKRASGLKIDVTIQKQLNINKQKTGWPKKTESLGNQLIEGVNAEGTRMTATIPVGEIGNIRPIEVVEERWYSPDLKIMVLTRHNDPRSGETIYRLSNIKRAEPDRSLFEIPAGYRIAEGVRGIRIGEK
jgi:hypothetical protein